MSVDRVLFGSIGGDQLELEEYGLELAHSSQVGDHGVYFLHQKTDRPGFYRIVNSQGRFLNNGQGGLVAPDDEADWVKVIEGELLSELESDVEDAVNAVADGRVEPAKPN